MPCFAAAPSVSVKTSNATVGETISVSVNLSANSGLAGLQFAVNFNSSEFELVNGSAQASSLFTALPVEKTSSVEFSGVSVNPVNSSGAVLTFKLKVLKTGGSISIKILDAINGDNQTVSVSASGATVKCSHSNAKWVVTKMLLVQKRVVRQESAAVVINQHAKFHLLITTSVTGRLSQKQPKPQRA